jgi:hypothetical protein
MWRSPAAGKAPHMSSMVSLSAWRCTKSRRENSSAWAGRSGAQRGQPHRLPPPSRSRWRSRPAPSTSRAVTTGKWLTPATVGDTASAGLPRAMARSIDQLPTSWQRPTALIEVWRHTARVRQVIGLVMLSNQASGQTLPMSSATPTSTGMLRRDRLMPPGPDGVPHRLADAVAGRHVQIDGHRVEPTGRDGDDHEVGALEGRLWSVVVSMVAPAPRDVVHLAGQRRSHLLQRTGSMSSSTMWRRAGTRCPAGRPGARASTGSCRRR